MIRHATSHGLSVLACSVTGGLIVEIAKKRLPEMMVCIERFFTLVQENLNMQIDGSELTPLVVASLLAMLWGAFFKLRFFERNDH